MGGPAASVLLRNALTRQQEDALEHWLRSHTHDLEKDKWSYQFWLNEDAFPGTVSRCLFFLSLGDPGDYWDEEEQEQIKTQLGYIPEQSIYMSSGCNQREDHITLGHSMLHLATVYDGLIDMAGAITPPQPPVDKKRVKRLLADSAERARAREMQAYMQVQLSALRASLPEGKTMSDLFHEVYSDPNSPLKAIKADMKAKFGPLLPPELSVSWPPLQEISAYVRAMAGTVYEIEYTTASDHRWVSHIVDIAFLQAWMRHPHFHMIK